MAMSVEQVWLFQFERTYGNFMGPGGVRSCGPANWNHRALLLEQLRLVSDLNAEVIFSGALRILSSARDGVRKVGSDRDRALCRNEILNSARAIQAFALSNGRDLGFTWPADRPTEFEGYPA